MRNSPALISVKYALRLLLAVWLLGAFALWLVGRGRWGAVECFYQSAITLFTVGFAELPGMEHTRGARSVTIAIIVLGVAAVALTQAGVNAVFIEGVLGTTYRRSRMRKAIAKLREHIVVAGAGSTGRYVLEELHATHRVFVVIDRDEKRLRELSDEVCDGEMLYVVGDATHDMSLLSAGIARASGVVAALTADADNLYVTLSARALNADARIVTKATQVEAEDKMRRAGANAVVSPNTIGGRRMASELVRPQVVEFLDQMHRADHSLRMEDVLVPEHSPLVGKLLREAALRPRTNALVVARRSRDGRFHYNPAPDLRIEPGETLIVLGDQTDIAAVRTIVTRG